MRLLLVRHAQAVEPPSVPADTLRWLTPDGRGTMRGVTGALEELGLRWTHIFSSPLVRAVQTAEILASPAWFDGPVEVHRMLAPDEGSVAQVLSLLTDLGPDAFPVLVGHEPGIRLVTGHLLGADAFPAFRTGGVCLVRWMVGALAELEWRLDPDDRRPIEGLGVEA